jgi:hypothetical protein
MKGKQSGWPVLEVLPQRFFYHGESDLIPGNVAFRKKPNLAAFTAGFDMGVNHTRPEH